MQKIRGKALVASGIAALGVYVGSKIVNSNDIKSESEGIIIGSVYNCQKDDPFVYEPIRIDEQNFTSFNYETFFTLFDEVQLFDYASNSNNVLSPDTINKDTVVVRGISTNGVFTLIEFGNGQRKYVYSDDIVQKIDFMRNEHNHLLNVTTSKTHEDYTINKDAYVYNRDGVCLGYLEEGTRCLEILSVDEYLFVVTENKEYYYINKEDLTLTKEYHKGFFPPKKLSIEDSMLEERNVYFDSFNDTTDFVWSVNFNNEVFVPKEEESYLTLQRNQLIYFNNGSIVPISHNYGIVVKVLKESDDLAYVMLSDNTTGYVNKRGLCNAYILDRSTFSPIIKNRSQITKDWDYFYDMSGAYQYPIYPNTNCIAIETNGEYTLVELPDGSRGYLNSSNLIDSKNQVSKYVYLKPDAKLYFLDRNNEMIEVKDNYLSGNITYMFYADGEYAYIGDYLCRENYYVKLSDIDFNYNIESVFSYGYVANDTTMNSQIDGLGNNSSVDDYDLYWIYYNCGDYSYVWNERTNEYGYIKTNELKTLSGCFYYVDLDNQRLYYYDDHEGKYYRVTKEWPIRSGNDSTPSHEGASDIDWKAKDFAFTTYPGAYARYWIPFNEYDEGFHDLIGDDEENYGNELYHTRGSHGCIRVPVEASEFIYYTSPVGTMVLVNRK